MRPLLYAAALLAVTGCMTDRPTAANAEMSPKLREALAGRTAGQPISCINLRDIRSTRIIDETAIVYEMNGGRWYVNMPAGGCSGLHPNRALVSRTPSTSLCSGDIVRIIDPPTPIDFGACGLGQFTPYAR